MYFTAQDGVRLYYEDRGANGDTVVMVHGAAGSGMSFDPLAQQLRNDFRVITVDLRGMSRSQRVEDVSATAWCDDTIGILDSAGVQAFHLVGCSLGARIGGRIARDYPNRVRTLAVDAPLLSATSGASASLNRRFEDLDHAKPEDLEKWQRYHGETWRDAVRFYGRVRNKPDLQEHLTISPWLASLTVPTLISRGGIDDVVHPLDHCIEWHRAHPKSSWLWIAPGIRFSLTQRCPAEYAAHYRRFVTHASELSRSE